MSAHPQRTILGSPIADRVVSHLPLACRPHLTGPGRTLTKQEGMDEHSSLWQIGVIGHGPRATELADQVATEISEWNQGWGNNPPEPSFPYGRRRRPRPTGSL